jgi:hypothetical protein
MPSNPDAPELRAYIDELIERTREGNLDWKEANASTFYWERGVIARLNLQRTERTVLKFPSNPQGGNKRETNYILQAFEVAANQWSVRFVIDGTTDAGLNDSLGVLFEEVRALIYRRNMKFLKDLLPPRKPS